MKRFKQWSKLVESIYFITQRVLKSQTLTKLLTTFVKQQLCRSVDGWHPNAKEMNHLTGVKPQQVAPPSLPDTSSNEYPLNLVRRRSRRACFGKQRARLQKVMKGRYVPSITTCSRSTRIRLYNISSSANYYDRRKDKHWVSNGLTKPLLPVLQTFKLRYVRVVDYRGYCLNNRSSPHHN